MRGPKPARDLIDFHLRWPEFRPLALALLDRPDTTAVEAETLRWLIALADRVGRDDLAG
ncbi:hypothetical protein [Polymorphum gilvum]|uniref:Uncharacterized protein n=1 Tax=Polymorphum gilvum (strain LMG 25793 / CGMCC 1.9160 / SL003B-26A1) TaxID=991905 RepID=F2IZI0_POLGS|nr:hypothetical protein [Polymorphum gilvum]ADZ68602.1 hypothetical protein SL003B_0164 [Polymorphum gilvum SL003B-26A1]